MNIEQHCKNVCHLWCLTVKNWEFCGEIIKDQWLYPLVIKHGHQTIGGKGVNWLNSKKMEWKVTAKHSDWTSNTLDSANKIGNIINTHMFILNPRASNHIWLENHEVLDDRTCFEMWIHLGQLSWILMFFVVAKDVFLVTSAMSWNCWWRLQWYFVYIFQWYLVYISYQYCWWNCCHIPMIYIYNDVNMFLNMIYACHT